MKISEEQKASNEKEKEQILELCETNQWEDAFEAYCKSSLAVDYYKSDFNRFFSRFKFILKKRKWGWKFTLLYGLSGCIMIASAFAVLFLALQGMLSPYGDPVHGKIIPLIIVSMVATFGSYRFRNYLAG